MLGARAGTTGATISRLEHGKQGLTTEWMIRIATALDVQPADLLEEDRDIVYVVVLGELDRKYEKMPERSEGTMMRVPAFHSALRTGRLVGFRNGEHGLIIADPVRTAHPLRVGSWVVVYFNENLGAPAASGEFSLRTFEHSISGGGGFLAHHGDPAIRWLPNHDKRIRHILHAVAEWKLLLEPKPKDEG